MQDILMEVQALLIKMLEDQGQKYKKTREPPNDPFTVYLLTNDEDSLFFIICTNAVLK